MGRKAAPCNQLHDRLHKLLRRLCYGPPSNPLLQVKPGTG